MLIYLSKDTEAIAARYIVECAYPPPLFNLLYFKGGELIHRKLDLVEFVNEFASFNSDSGIILTDHEFLSCDLGVFVVTGSIPDWEEIREMILLSAKANAYLLNFPLATQLDVLGFFFANFGWKSWKVFDQEIGNLLYLAPDRAILCANLNEMLTINYGNSIIATSEVADHDYFDNWHTSVSLSGEIEQLFPDLRVIEEGDDWHYYWEEENAVYTNGFSWRDEDWR